MKQTKRILSVLLCLAVLLTALPGTAFAEDKVWIETDADTVYQRYRENDDFIAVFYVPWLDMSMQSILFERWLNVYGITVYGINMETMQHYPNWIGLQGTIYLPIITVVCGDTLISFTGDDNITTVQKTVNELFGIDDENHYGFLPANERTFRLFSVNEKEIREKYLTSLEMPVPDVVSLAQSITANCRTDTEKVKTIYDWVADNIYYDFGMYYGYYTGGTSAAYTLANRRSVCEGYANLTAAMCRSVGVPARVVTGYAGGASKDELNTLLGLTESYANGTMSAPEFRRSIFRYVNHAWNLVFLDGRWVILDATWGSGNMYYPDEGYMAGSRTDFYYDMSLEDVSSDHLFLPEYRTFQISLTSTQYCSLTGSGVYAEGETVVITVERMPEGAESFVGWAENGVLVSTALTYSFTADRDRSLEAVFEMKAQHVHEYTATITAPTCNGWGYTTYTCSCGDSYTDSFVAPHGHDFGEWIQTKAPTATEKGEETRACIHCGLTETREIPATGIHTLSELEIVALTITSNILMRLSGIIAACLRAVKSLR